MVKVRLRGLKIARARDKYYVYIRATGETLLQGFEGTKADLEKRLSEPDMIGAYNARRKRGPKSYAEKTLGWLVAWYRDPDQCPEYKDLSDASKEDYDAALTWLEPEYDAILESITQAAIYEVRDRCAREKWPAFADKVTTALSSMFTAAAKRGKMPGNPAMGVDRAHKSNPNANREWHPSEWLAVAGLAASPPDGLHDRPASRLSQPEHCRCRLEKLPIGSTLSHVLQDGTPKECLGTALAAGVAAAPGLSAGLKVRTKDGPIALRYNGQPWESPEQLQKQSSNFLAKLERKGLIREGLTLHGLRSSFAAEIKRVNDDQVAAALGDRDTKMGKHYTRHVEQENRVAFLFFSRMMGTGIEQDLENGRVQVFQNEQKDKP